MKLERRHIWRIIGVVVASLLLLYWLFAGTIIDERESDETPMEIVPVE